MLRSSVVEEIPREQFVSIWTILFFVSVVLGILGMLLLKNDLLEDATHQLAPSMVTVEYLDELIAIYPNDQNLQMAKIQELLRLYEIPKARYALSMLPPLKNKAQMSRRDWLAYRLQYAEFSALTADNPLKNAAKSALATTIDNLSKETLSSDQTLDLAEAALALPDFTLVRAIYPRFSDGKRTLPATQYVRAAKIAIAVGDYKPCSDLYFKAQAMTPELVVKRHYFKLGVQALQQGDMVNQALASAEQHIVGLHLDRPTMIMMVRLALAANQPAIAQKYIQRALQMRKVATE